ncbi:MAG: sigma-70 family RNA polymerase sigma factor [Nibricoccus sp.]
METDSEKTSSPAEGASVAAAQKASQLVEHFFRHETGRLHGALTRLLGPQNLSLVEDVAQEAMMKAFRAWSFGGPPANPSAWITQVAMNLARDALRHRKMSYSKEGNIITHFEQTVAAAGAGGTGDMSADVDADFRIRDDSLRMLFVCSHPSIAADAQVVLALKVLGGFSTAEIARAFFSSDAAIEKQLTRTKQRIAEAKLAFDLPEGAELAERLDGVLSTLYLIFNEGYKASTGEKLLREELCREAIRLTLLLVEHPAGRSPQSHALLAFMLLTAARFPARVDDQGDLLRLDDQDRSKWDFSLIERGLVQLAQAAHGKELSEYHLQAGIAACHCMAPDYASTDWARILRLYDDLQRLKPSPVIAMNRAVVVAHLHGPQAALDAIASMPQRERLESHYLLHAIVGELNHRLNQHEAAVKSFRRALHLAQVGPEQTHLSRMLERSEGLSQSG